MLRKKADLGGKVVIDFAVPLKQGRALRATVRCSWEIGPKCRACWHLLGGAERCRRQRTCKHLVVVLEWWWITTVVVCGGRQQGKMKVML